MNLEHLLRESIGRYRVLQHLLCEVNEALKKARSDEIEALAEQMESLQRQVLKLDLDLLSLLAREETAASGQLFKEWHELLQGCSRQFALLLPEAAARKALVTAELLQAKEGRTAMAGYGSGGKARGNMLNDQV